MEVESFYKVQIQTPNTRVALEGDQKRTNLILYSFETN